MFRMILVIIFNSNYHDITQFSPYLWISKSDWETILKDNATARAVTGVDIQMLMKKIGFTKTQLNYSASRFGFIVN